MEDANEPLCLILVCLALHIFDIDFDTVFGDNYVFLFHLLLASFGQLVCEFIELRVQAWLGKASRD